MTAGEWVVLKPEREAARAFKEAGYPSILARLLINRGIKTPDEACSFLRGGVPLSDPLILGGMGKCAKRIMEAIGSGEKIVVYGDYDVDGVTATALLLGSLRRLGGDADFYIPDRETEGYGVNSGAVRYICGSGASLIITVDTGISAFDEAALVNSLGADFIITDHHEPRDALPCAYAVVDPKSEDGCPCRELAGVGVAFKLACALEGGEPDGDAYALAALGTVADVVPLVGENRELVRRGLEDLAAGKSPGLSALLAAAGVSGEARAETLAFTAAPRINAAGRMGNAGDALRLLLTHDKAEADALARELDRKNRLRQETEEEIFEQALLKLAQEGDNNPVLILRGEGWHPGVIGIVASRLAELTGKPTVLVSFENGVGRASCRSFPGFDIHAALMSCRELLERFGGHELAAGFTVAEENYDELCTCVQSFAHSLPPMPLPSLVMEFALSPEEISLGSARLCELLEPCGEGNPAPLFFIPGARVLSVTPLKEGKHLRLSMQYGQSVFKALYFGAERAGFSASPGDRLDLAAQLRVNRFRGEESLSVVIRAARPHWIFCDTRRIYDGAPDAAGDIPQREDFAAVYRLLQRMGGRLQLAEAEGYLAEDAPGFSLSKLQIALEVFGELGLVEIDAETEDAIIYNIVRGKKISLNESTLLRHLEGYAVNGGQGRLRPDG